MEFHKYGIPIPIIDHIYIFKPPFLVIRKVCFHQYELVYPGRIKFLHVEMRFYTVKKIDYRQNFLTVKKIDNKINKNRYYIK